MENHQGCTDEDCWIGSLKTLPFGAQVAAIWLVAQTQTDLGCPDAQKLAGYIRTIPGSQGCLSLLLRAQAKYGSLVACLLGAAGGWSRDSLEAQIDEFAKMHAENPEAELTLLALRSTF